uniref:Putative short chain dehydrogenase/reductase family protein n=1 Tax=uncultured bacterium Ad_139_A06_contig2 TaxID=1489304 RepID=A0A0B4N175_9BACT|nr:putative short chain dehydrogenase/reductase family protein [uncultured bacterium Ad_139_A06_contig2]
MRHYLITGAAGGMGRALSKALTESGHEVWGIVRRKTEDWTGFHPVCADLCRTDQLDSAAQQVIREAGSLDGIIHMAGVYDLDSLVEIEESAFLRDFDVNLFGVYRVNKLFLHLLKKGGRIVIVTSELAPLDPLPFTGIYAVTKAALDKYAFSLRMELQMLGIDVVVIRPGAVDTGMISDSVRKLNRFCSETELYSVNATRFKTIVGRIETKTISPEKLCRTVRTALEAKKPRLVYTINRNPLLLLMNALPQRLQLSVIRKILS